MFGRFRGLRGFFGELLDFEQECLEFVVERLLFFLDGFPLVLVVVLLKRRETLRVMRTNWVPGLFAGAVSLFAIWLVMWALALAPMAYVSALRETSTMFAVIIGVVFLKEHLDLRRLAAVFCAVAGSLLLKISR